MIIKGKIDCNNLRLNNNTSREVTVHQEGIYCIIDIDGPVETIEIHPDGITLWET